MDGKYIIDHMSVCAIVFTYMISMVVITISGSFP